ncbi:MAG: o-succinylbenzoate synthase [Actinomycetales bacterium]
MLPDPASALARDPLAAVARDQFAAVAAGHVVSIPMRERFRGIDVREAVLLEGEAGWAEWSPFWDYAPDTAAAWWRSTAEALTEPWPQPVRDTVPVNATVPAVPAERVADVLSRYGSCRAVKVKVTEGGRTDDATVAADIDRLAAVRDAVGWDVAVRIDINGGWSLEEALRLLPRYDGAAGGLEYVEQPCADVEDLARLRRHLDVPVAADESIRRAEDPYRVAQLHAADIAVLKVQPLGGVRACLRIAEQIGLPVVVSSALETSVGIAAGVALAAALPELPHACGLATVNLLSGDVVDDSLVPVDGAIAVRRPQPSPVLLERWAAGEDARRRWRERANAVRDVLDGAAA